MSFIRIINSGNKFLISCGLIYYIFSCANVQKNKRVETNASKIIIAKWSFIETSANLLDCEDDESNSPTSCVFTYEGKRYKRNDSYKLDRVGKIDSVYAYHNPLGVNIYSLEDYCNYKMSIDTVELKKIRIKWDDKNKEVIDNNKIIRPTRIEAHQVVIKNKSDLIIYELDSEKPQ